METGSVLIVGILFFVPAKVGTQEGGKVFLFSALGLDPVRGLTVGIVRRIRELAYAGLGLAVLASAAAARTHHLSTPAALTSGYHLAFAIGALFALAAAVIGATFLRTRTVAAGQHAEPIAA